MSSLKHLSLKQLLEEQFPIRDHLILPWLRQGESAMVYAKPGVGKSMFALTLALGVAGGGDGSELIGWEFPKPRKVLFWDGEMYADDLQERAKLLIPTIGGLNLDEANENLTFVARQYQDHKVTFPDISDIACQKAVFDAALSNKADLVILDNLSTLATSMEDENAAAEFNKIIYLLMRFKQANIACMLIHHSNKKGEDYRGSSKLATTFEVILHLRELNNIKSRQGAAFVLDWTKYRNKRDESTVNREVWLGRDDREVFGWHHQTSKSDQAAMAVELVKSLEFPFQKDIAGAMGISTGNMSKIRTRAVSSGMITDKEWDRYLEAAREEVAEEDPYGMRDQDF